MMKRSFRDRFTAALRSGDYLQNDTYLRRCDEYCCLGVALTIDGRWDALPSPHLGAGVYAFDGEPGTLTERARLHLGMGDDLVEELITRNDRGDSFAQIADYLDTLPVEDDIAPAGSAS